MRKDLLLKLADLLEADAANPKGIKFNLNEVVRRRNLDLDATEVAVDCGTTACAMGLAAISGAFKEEGLGYEIEHDLYPSHIELTFNGEQENFNVAAARLFDIEVYVADRFFDPSWYCGVITGAEGELRVAKRIRKYVESDGESVPTDCFDCND